MKKTRQHRAATRLQSKEEEEKYFRNVKNKKYIKN